MNILMVAKSTRPSPGGVEELTHQLATHLARRGERVHMLTRSLKGAAEFDRQLEYRVTRISSSHLWSRRGLADLYFSWKILRAAANCQAEVIVVTSLWSWPHQARRIARLRNIPFAVLVHGNDLNVADRKGGSGRRHALHSADAVIANSSATAARAEALGVDPGRLKVVHPGVDLSQFNNGKCSAGALREKLGIGDRRMLLTVGRLVERKGHDTVIRAMRHVVREVPNAVYVVVGQGPEEIRLRELAAELEVPAVFCGRESDGELAEYYRACDAFIMPSREIGQHDVEGFGIVYLEAAACGKPVVAGRSGGTGEAVADKQTGILVDPLDDAEVAKAAVRVMMDTEYARLLGENGRRHVAQNFDWPIIAQKHLQVLESVVAFSKKG